MTDHPWEDHLLERKTENDLKDLLKTLVAFANSVMPDHVAVILIGEKDDGSVQGVSNPDQIQKKIRKEAERIYPPIVYRTRQYDKDGFPCIRVEIEPSFNTPHFGGEAWVRKGSSTEMASEALFQKLVELRLQKVRELSKWIGKKITIRVDTSTLPWGSGHANIFPGGWNPFLESSVVEVNRFWVTFRNNLNEQRSYPLEKILLSFDDSQQRLEVLVMFSGQSGL